jgi:O-antigen ligase
MVALAVAGLVAFILMPKRPLHLALMLAVVVCTLALAGKEVRARFLTAFAAQEERDASAQSRLQLWGNLWDTMCEHPVVGVGPNHFALVSSTFGWKAGKEGHSMWLQIGAELGFPALLLLAAAYGLCVIRLWPLARPRASAVDPQVQALARMVITALVGFAVAAQFISLWALEAPYYVLLVGAGILRLPPGEPGDDETSDPR